MARVAGALQVLSGCVPTSGEQCRTCMVQLHTHVLTHCCADNCVLRCALQVIAGGRCAASGR